MIKGKVSENTSKLYTGITDVNVLGFNPDAEGINKIYNKQDSKEVVYTSTSEEGHGKIRIDVFVQEPNTKTITKIAFFLEDKDRANKEGNKFQWINDVGQSTWIDSIENLNSERQKYFNINKNPRIAKVGEVGLYDFLVSWAGIDQRAEDSEIKLDTSISDIISGNVTELNQLVKQLGERKVRVLFTVRDGKYQSVFNGWFNREMNTYVKALDKIQAGEYPCKDDYQKTYVFKSYIPSMDAPTGENHVAKATDSDVKEFLNV